MRPAEWIASTAFLHPALPLFFAVFAVFAGNYQRATSPSLQKSWSSGSPAEQGTARRRAVSPCKSAKGDLAGAEIVCNEPTICCHLRITIFIKIASISDGPTTMPAS
jgi:hypothetical protein